MSQTRKQRLLGVLLLLSLAVIFLPMILDGSGYRERQQQEITIPSAPPAPQMQSFTPQNKVFEEPEVIAPPRPQPVKQPEPEVAKKVVAKEKPKASSQNRMTLTKEKPVLDTQGVPVAWTIQLASFKDSGNARQLEKRLIAKGYKAYLRRKGDLNKVFVGPDIQRTEVEKLRLQLKKEFKLDGLILRFTTS